MNQEWYCTSKAVAQIVIAFIFSTYDEIKTQTWYLSKVAVTELFFATTCRQAHWTRWSLLQVKFCSKGTSQLWQSRRRLRATELICQYQANLKNFNYWTRERRKTHFSFSSLIKQVLKSPNKSTMIDDSIKNYARNNPEQIGYSIVSHGDSVNHALRHSNLERHEVLKIEDRVQCHRAKFRRDILYSWKHSSWHEAGRATDQQSIHHVIPWSSQISFGNFSKRSTLWKLWCITKPQEIKRLIGFRKKIEWRNNRGAPPRGRAVPNAHARSWILAFLVEIDRIANVKLTSLAPSLERAFYRGLYKVVQSCQGGGSGTTAEKGRYDQTSLRSRCWTVVIVVFLDMVTFIKVFVVGFFVIADTA